MSFSKAVERQRQKESKGLKRCLTYSFTGSLLIHGGVLLLKLNLSRNLERPVSEEIAIIVTEPLLPSAKAETENAASAEARWAGNDSIDVYPQTAQQLATPSDPNRFTPIPARMSEEPLQQKPSASLDTSLETLETSLLQDNPSVQSSTPLKENLTPIPTTSLSTTTAFSPKEEAIENTPVENASAELVPTASTNPLTNLESLRNWLAEVRRNRDGSRHDGLDHRPLNRVGSNHSTHGESGPGGNGVGSGIGARRSQGSVAPGSGTAPGNRTEQSARRRGPGDNGAGSREASGEASASRQIACRSCPKPEYPTAALESGAEGSIRVNVEVDENGRVVGVSLVGSSGNADLDQAVLETVREQYEFEGVGDGGATIPIEVDMTLDGSDFNRRARERGDQTSIETQAPAPVAEPAPRPIESTPAAPTVAPIELLPTPSPTSAEPTPSVSPSEPMEGMPVANPEPISPVEPDPSASASQSEPLRPEAAPMSEPMANPDPIPTSFPAGSSTESIDRSPPTPSASEFPSTPE